MADGEESSTQEADELQDSTPGRSVGGEPVAQIPSDDEPPEDTTPEPPEQDQDRQPVSTIPDSDGSDPEDGVPEPPEMNEGQEPVEQIGEEDTVEPPEDSVPEPPGFQGDEQPVERIGEADRVEPPRDDTMPIPPEFQDDQPDPEPQPQPGISDPEQPERTGPQPPDLEGPQQPDLGTVEAGIPASVARELRMDVAEQLPGVEPENVDVFIEDGQYRAEPTRRALRFGLTTFAAQNFEEPEGIDFDFGPEAFRVTDDNEVVLRDDFQQFIARSLAAQESDEFDFRDFTTIETDGGFVPVVRESTLRRRAFEDLGDLGQFLDRDDIVVERSERQVFEEAGGEGETRFETDVFIQEDAKRDALIQLAASDFEEFGPDDIRLEATRPPQTPEGRPTFNYNLELTEQALQREAAEDFQEEYGDTFTASDFEVRTELQDGEEVRITELSEPALQAFREQERQEVREEAASEFEQFGAEDFEVETIEEDGQTFLQPRITDEALLEQAAAPFPGLGPEDFEFSGDRLQADISDERLQADFEGGVDIPGAEVSRTEDFLRIRFADTDTVLDPTQSRVGAGGEQFDPGTGPSFDISDHPALQHSGQQTAPDTVTLDPGDVGSTVTAEQRIAASLSLQTGADIDAADVTISEQTVPGGEAAEELSIAGFDIEGGAQFLPDETVDVEQAELSQEAQNRILLEQNREQIEAALTDQLITEGAEAGVGPSPPTQEAFEAAGIETGDFEERELDFDFEATSEGITVDVADSRNILDSTFDIELLEGGNIAVEDQDSPGTVPEYVPDFVRDPLEDADAWWRGTAAAATEPFGAPGQVAEGAISVVSPGGIALLGVRGADFATEGLLDFGYDTLTTTAGILDPGLERDIETAVGDNAPDASRISTSLERGTGQALETAITDPYFATGALAGAFLGPAAAARGASAVGRSNVVNQIRAGNVRGAGRATVDIQNRLSAGFDPARSAQWGIESARTRLRRRNVDPRVGEFLRGNRGQMDLQFRQRQRQRRTDIDRQNPIDPAEAAGRRGEGISQGIDFDIGTRPPRRSVTERADLAQQMRADFAARQEAASQPLIDTSPVARQPSGTDLAELQFGEIGAETNLLDLRTEQRFDTGPVTDPGIDVDLRPQTPDETLQQNIEDVTQPRQVFEQFATQQPRERLGFGRGELSLDATQRGAEATAPQLDVQFGQQARERARSPEQRLREGLSPRSRTDVFPDIDIGQRGRTRQRERSRQQPRFRSPFARGMQRQATQQAQSQRRVPPRLMPRDDRGTDVDDERRRRGLFSRLFEADTPDPVDFAAGTGEFDVSFDFGFDDLLGGDD